MNNCRKSKRRQKAVLETKGEKEIKWNPNQSQAQDRDLNQEKDRA